MYPVNISHTDVHVQIDTEITELKFIFLAKKKKTLFFALNF